MKNPTTITVRRMQFNLDESMPKYWNDNDPFKTHLFNAISMLLPPGERFFIRCLRENLPYLKQDDNTAVIPALSRNPHQTTGEHQETPNPARGDKAALIDDVRKFMGQEGCHDHQHVLYNNILRAQGFNVSRLENIISNHLALASKISSRKSRMALTVAFEHFTTILAHALLSEESWLHNAHPAYATLWRWHAIEEIEHKAVTFDVYQAIKGGYFTRIREVFFGTIILCYHITAYTCYFLFKDKLFFKPKVWWRGLKFLWGKSGVFWKILPMYFSFYRPSYHPWQHDNSALTKQWEKDLFMSQVKSDNPPT
ncbi:MAG: hypothetical protein DHS20C10_14160 [marine bacterium B5-7]|nr:MAG: hypothetical protein DHS20C10_14160 [marine bacterium B5-7]